MPDDLTLLGVTAGAPTVGSPTFGQIHNLTIASITAGVPRLGVPRFRDYSRWQLTPDWSRPVEEEIEFLTEIIRNRDGTEQRIAQRVNPRHSFRWRVRGSEATLRAMEQSAAWDQARPFYFTHPRAAVRLERGVPEAEGFFGEFTEGLQFSSPTDTVVETADISVRAVPGMSLTQATFPAATITYRGREVMPLAPNWSRSMRVTLEQMFEDFDFGRGVTDRNFPEALTKRQIEAEYLIRNQAQEEALLGLFYRMRGRQKAFYVADPLTTLDPVLPVPAGQSFITLPGVAAYRAYENEPTYRNIEFRTTTGTIYRRVSGVTLNSGNARLALTEPLPALTEATLISARWLYLARFNIDALTLNWITDLHATVRAVYHTLEDPV